MPEIAPLSNDHDRAGFDCGVAELNAFLKSTARQHVKKGISRTFVLTDQESPAVIMGFFTLTLCEIEAESLPSSYARKYPKHGLPAVRLARLAVSLKHQRKGYGELLLAEAIHRTVLISEQAGIVGLFVDAKNEGARSFYEKFGFASLPSASLQLFLPMKTLHAANSPT
ncbi:GNAT family N-acetyltransferase [Geobacter sp.]|uniref:GNAT family N-acetyltransferase n=1 Tax=Geobacter sp. TaxID=46610 RepID=UPI002625537C|nr:GNAT family N-acetyltransferase [Geobacter sp.]